MNDYKRTIKTISFAANEYEYGLLEYATKPEHGPFSQYVKRLIERDRAGVSVVRVPNAPEKAPDRTEKDRAEAMRLMFGD